MAQNPSPNKQNGNTTPKKRTRSEVDDEEGATAETLKKLRYSQVERFLGTNPEAESNLLGLSDLGEQDPSNFWEGEITGPEELQKKDMENSQLQRQLLRGVGLRSSRDTVMDPAVKIEPEDPLTTHPRATASVLSQSDQRLFNDIMTNELNIYMKGFGENPDMDVDHSSTSSTVSSSDTTSMRATSTRQTAAMLSPGGVSGAATSPKSPQFGGKPNLRTAMGPSLTGKGAGAAIAQPSSEDGSSEPGSPQQDVIIPVTEASQRVVGHNLQAEALITQLHGLDATLDNQLKSIKFQQRRVIESTPLNQAQLEKLTKQQESINKTISDSIKTLETLYETQVLGSTHAYILINSLDNFRLHSKQLQLLQEEVLQLQTAGTVKPVAALAITKQPFPCTVKQSKSLDDPVEVRVLTGSKADITGSGVVHAEMINEDYNPVSKKKNAQPSIRNEQESIKETGVATFKKLTFPHGSRVKSVNMKFGAEVNVNGTVLRLQSEATRPFIVMTNHGQRSITEGKLLKKSTFVGRSEIPWALFANTLQLHYLRATKQDPMKPPRPLTMKDISYLHLTKFAGRLSITQEDYDEFWKWFGKILYKIRNHQKHILPMWTKGLIYGFLSREESDNILKNANPRSFLIRFSDRRPGQFVIVYVNELENNGREVKHYLVRQEDMDKKSTLPDFLRDCENLWYILQLVRDPETGVVNLRSRPKDKVLSPYYTRRPAAQLPIGYDLRQP